MDFNRQEHKILFIPIEEFKAAHEKEIDKIRECDKYFMFTLWFYNQRTNKFYPFKKKLPIWLYEFVLNFKGNLDCVVLPKEQYKDYPFKYIWYSECTNDKIMFEVWKRNTDTIYDTAKKISCRVMCRYEMEELNSPGNLGGFINTNEP